MAKKTGRKKASKASASGGGARAVASSGEGVARKASGARRTGSRQTYKTGQASGKDLVIVESPSKAKTINRYLGDSYHVMASIGHVRDLPSRNPKGKKSPVPGVDLENRFRPSYEVLSGKEQIIKDLKAAARDARSSGHEVWFATDLDREGEAIAWHLAQELGIPSGEAKRVVFASITKTEIERAFGNPHPIDDDRVNAQQARRILDRIVGYQVSPLLWKKVAAGLSAGRVQSVAVRLVVEREREIRRFVPDERWSITALFALDEASARGLGPSWRELIAQREEKGNPPSVKSQNAWLSRSSAIRAELVELTRGGASERFELGQSGADFLPPPDPITRERTLPRGRTEADLIDPATGRDLSGEAASVASALGLRGVEVSSVEDPSGKGPARWRRTIRGEADPSAAYRIRSIETKRTRAKPSPPLITSTMQQAASTRLGFGAQRTMRTAQQLYEGIEIPGEGPVGLITYMRTDSTHLSPEAVASARAMIGREYGEDYLPSEPRRYASSNKGAQEAHEAIRPTSLEHPPERVARALSADQLRLYTLIWNRFVACQMTDAQWDGTTVLIDGPAGAGVTGTFRATGRTLAFDGFYRVMGVPQGDELNLPRLGEGQALHPFAIDAEQRFGSPPARYTEAGLIKVLEAEGIGRPSTYASIIQVIQDRKYVEQVGRAFHATDLGEVVTDKLVEGFPDILDVGYTRDMEANLDRVEEEHLDWIDMLERFYADFRRSLESAESSMSHAKAETIPAPKEYRCEKCGADLVYRFGRNGKFLSCSRYPDCDFASPIDREGRPMADEFVDVRCPRTGRPMVRKNGRFGPFVTTALERGEPNDVGIILNIDKKGRVVAPSPPPLETDLPCPTCGSALNLRDGIRGPWLGCSRFPKCRGRGKWTELDERRKAGLGARLAEHAREHPIPVIVRFTTGEPLTDANGRALDAAPTVDDLRLEGDPRPDAAARHAPGAGSGGGAPREEPVEAF